jgi:Phosphotransferase enzyme family
MIDSRGAHYDRLQWVQPDWLSEAKAWIETQLESRGVTVSGEIDQFHVRSWSTVMRVPTSAGDVYFKAKAPVHQFEAGLSEALARWRPDCTPTVLAVDADRGWLLLADAGTRLRDLDADEHLAHWERILPLYAGFQIELADRRDELLALGVRDVRLATVPRAYEQLLDDAELGLTADERARLRALAPELEEMCEEVAAIGIGDSLQHDDLHDGNVFVDRGNYRFLDWGDSCVSHPFHTLVVTFRSIVWSRDLPPGAPELKRLRDAYLDAWTSFGSLQELRAAFRLAYRIGTVCRTFAWAHFARGMEPEFRAENAETVPYGLRLFLADGPIGSLS